MIEKEKLRPEGLPFFDVKGITDVIRNRRSIKPKDFNEEIIDREEIELLLANAHWAPNHGETEPWYFIVFEGEGRQRLAEGQSEIYRSHTPKDEFKQSKYEKLQKQPLLCSHVIAICHRRGDKKKIPVIEEVEAVAAAVQNLHLTATAMGLAGYWNSGGMTYHPEMKKFLGLREEDQVLGFFMLGKTKKNWPKGKRKKHWEEKVRWEN